MRFLTLGLLVFFVLAVLEVSSALGASCPQNFDTEDYGIYDNTCYFFISNKTLTYEQALEECQKNGGTLAMPKTEGLNYFLLYQMEKLNIEKAMWIGMHDKEGEYVWEDGTEVKPWGNMHFLNGWMGEDCVALHPSDGKWHDYMCSDSRIFESDRLPFICQHTLQDDNLTDDNGAKADLDKGQGDSAKDTQGQGDNGKDTQGQGDSGNETQGQGDSGNDTQGQGDKVEDDKDCPEFNCPNLDCGMDGFKTSGGCQICECNE